MNNISKKRRKDIVLKTVCIKTISEEKIIFLIKLIEKYEINVCISNYRFKTYDNLILHYLSNENIDNFYKVVSTIIRKCIENYYEEELVKKSIESNYFYLTQLERKNIYEITKKILELPDEKIGFKRKLLNDLIYEYILDNKKIVLEGFVNFRLKKYRELLDRIIEVSVFSYLDLITF